MKNCKVTTKSANLNDDLIIDESFFSVVVGDVVEGSVNGSIPWVESDGMFADWRTGTIPAASTTGGGSGVSSTSCGVSLGASDWTSEVVVAATLSVISEFTLDSTAALWVTSLEIATIPWVDGAWVASVVASMVVGLTVVVSSTFSPDLSELRRWLSK